MKAILTLESRANKQIHAQKLSLLISMLRGCLRMMYNKYREHQWLNFVIFVYSRNLKLIVH